MAHCTLLGVPSKLFKEVVDEFAAAILQNFVVI